MAFLNKLRSLPMPPVKNVLNVAMQTARQTIPSNKKNSEYEDPSGGQQQQPGGGPPPLPPRPQSVRFADQQGAFFCEYTICVYWFGFLVIQHFQRKRTSWIRSAIQTALHKTMAQWTTMVAQQPLSSRATNMMEDISKRAAVRSLRKGSWNLSKAPWKAGLMFTF